MRRCQVIVKCGWHEKYYGKEKIIGEKEPLKDKSVTHGLCKKCEKKFKKEIDLIDDIKNKKRLERKIN